MIAGARIVVVVDEIPVPVILTESVGFTGSLLVTVNVVGNDPVAAGANATSMLQVVPGARVEPQPLLKV